MSLGNKILKLRKKEGLSQEELGNKINVTRQTISNWELDETSPNPEQLKKLSHELHVSIDELLDNDVNDLIIKKVSNTENNTKLSLKLLKILIIIVISFVLTFIILCITKIIVKNSVDKGREIEETIHCSIYGEEHTFSINYYELTGVPFALGGDPYFSDILELDKYNDAHQIFNIINDYVKKNGGTCEMIKDRDLNNIVDISIKEGTLTKTSATIIIKETVDYDISYGEPFILEKYNNGEWEELPIICDNCAFNLQAYNVTIDKPLELYQDWSRLYGELPKGVYRLVKDVDFDSDIPIDENDKFYIWVEFFID